GRTISATAFEQVEPSFQSLQKHHWREQPGAGGGQLDSQRKAVESGTQGCNSTGVFGRELEVRTNGPGALHEQPHGGRSFPPGGDLIDRRHGERWYRKLLLATNPERHPARREH